MADSKLTKLIKEHNTEIRQSIKKSDTWPGYNTPLGKSGYWYGNFNNHAYIGRTKRELELFISRLP